MGLFIYTEPLTNLSCFATFLLTNRTPPPREKNESSCGYSQICISRYHLRYDHKPGTLSATHKAYTIYIGGRDSKLSCDFDAAEAFVAFVTFMKKADPVKKTDTQSTHWTWN